MCILNANRCDRLRDKRADCASGAEERERKTAERKLYSSINLEDSCICRWRKTSRISDTTRSQLGREMDACETGIRCSAMRAVLRELMRHRRT